jgi:crotonobetainyl-CoA:carnitine CoA-transferase CaiB-like acyl-CoA transferase
LGALSHIRVLDLSRVLAGPWATQILGDLGAEIVKIEKPGEGDETRAFGPPFLQTRDGARGDATYFLSANRNKQSVTIDFSKPEGAALIRRLARRSHIVVENFKTGTLARYGLDYATLAADNPALVYCSLTGFGHDGPYKDKAGYDYLIQGMGGLMSITGQPDGTPGAEPMKVGVAVSDLFTSLYSAIAILAALIHQGQTGEGQAIDMALFDCQAAALANQATNYLVGGTAPTRLGNAHPNIVPYQVFPTADGHLILAVANDRQFARFCSAANIDHLASDPRFVTNATGSTTAKIIDPAETGSRFARDRRLDRAARSGQRALRPDQHSRPGVRRSAGHRARADDFDGARRGRSRRSGGKPDPAYQNTAGIPLRAASSGPAHGRRA